MVNVSVTGGTLVDTQRQEVVETLSAINEGNVSVKGGTLVIKSMEQIAKESVPETTATQSLAEPFRQPIAQEGESLRPQVRPEKINVETKELPDAPAASGVQPSSKKDLLEFIGQGEGTYNSLNRGTINGNIIGAEREGSRGGKKISELTISEIRNYQLIKDPNNPERLFTVGKYQTRPSTFEQAVKGLELSDDTVFSPDVQDQIGIYLVGEKRPRLGRFLEGNESVSVDTAMLDLALEFASMPVPYNIKAKTFADGTLPKVDLVAGDSFYKDKGAEQGNRALKTVEETREILLKTRDSSQ